MRDMPNHTDDNKGFFDWKCTKCGQMFHQEYDCDTTQCPTCINKWTQRGEKHIQQPKILKGLYLKQVYLGTISHKDIDIPLILS
jgi:hypothetical protein